MLRVFVSLLLPSKRYYLTSLAAGGFFMWAMFVGRFVLVRCLWGFFLWCSSCRYLLGSGDLFRRLDLLSSSFGELAMLPACRRTTPSLAAAGWVASHSWGVSADFCDVSGQPPWPLEVFFLCLLNFMTFCLCM
jgi:hypothetical protein